MEYEDFTEKDNTDPGANWVIPGLLPDAVVILEGRGGLGKSTLITDLAATITTGKTWPYRTKDRKVRPGGVLIYANEDRKAVIRQRLSDAGADVSKVRRFTKAQFASEMDELEAHMKAKNARLVVLDPVQDYLGINTRDPEETRWMMTQLDLLAEKYHACIMLIRHMRKDANDQDPMEDGGLGTGQLRNFVRAVYRLIIDPDDDKKRLFMVTKFNYGPFPPTLVFKHDEKVPTGVTKLVWDKDPSRWNAFNLMARPKDEVKRVQARECDKWMKRMFRKNHYRLPAKAVLEAGKEIGFSASTIQRSRVKLNVATERLGWGQQARYMWVHPLYNPNDEEDPDLTIPPDLSDEDDMEEADA